MTDSKKATTVRHSGDRRQDDRRRADVLFEGTDRRDGDRRTDTDRRETVRFGPQGRVDD